MIKFREKRYSYREEIDRSHRNTKVAEDVIHGAFGMAAGMPIGVATNHPGTGMLVGAATGVGLHRLRRKLIKADEKEKAIKDQMEKEYEEATRKYDKLIYRNRKKASEELDKMRNLKKDPALRIMKDTSWIAKGNQEKK